MKHGRNPTVAQRKLLSEKRFQVDNWLVVKDTPTEMVIQHRYFEDNIRIIRKKDSEDA